MDFVQINSLLSIVEKTAKFFRRRSTSPKETIAQRFLQLYEAHGVHRNQIPRFLDNHLTVADVASEETLTSALSENILAKSCELFAINREWLDGASDQIYPLHHFYKSPKEFIPFIREIEERSLINPRGLVMKSSSRGYEDDVAIIIAEGVAFLDDQPVYRHHICPGWSFRYWKSRAYLTACIAIAWKEKIHLHGREIDHAVMRKYTQGTCLISVEPGLAFPNSGKRWEPEDMALRPQTFLKGINPEKQKFGHKAGLELWLELHDQGLMDTGLPSADARAEFSNRLARLKR